jgi:uncharacterized protein YecT (DUF1311 family)/surface antigen
MAILGWIASIALASPTFGQGPTAEETFSDRQIINRVLQEQLEHGRSNEPVEWHNPQTRHGGRIVVFPATPRDNTHCRPYEFTWSLGTRSTRIRGMPCRNNRGIWVGADEIQIESFDLPRTAAVASFECRNATRMDEQLICSDGRVAAIDAEMGRRYSRLRALTPRQEHTSVVEDQVEWIARRNRECGIGDRLALGGRDHWQQLVSCLATQTTARGHALQARVTEIEEKQQASEREQRELRELIVRVQRNLRRLAYIDSAETGMFDSRLRAAIQEFERDDGLPVTGTPSQVVVARSQAVIDRMSPAMTCQLGKETVHTQRICGRVGRN